MSRIAIVGDVHLAVSVSSRIDDYFNTCLNKLAEIARDNTHVIFLGDVFNTPLIANSYFISFYNFLQKYIEQGVQFYSIVGNHDVYNEREDSLDRTTLGLCDTLGVIRLILPNRPLTIGDITFHTTYVNLEKARKHLSTQHYGDGDILLLHHFFEDQYEGFSYDELAKLGCQHIFLGHEHTPFPSARKVYNEFTVYRSGSLLRNSAGIKNFNRGIFYFIIEDSEIKGCTVECAHPAEDVFTHKALTQQDLHRKEFVTNINDVLNKYALATTTQSKFSIQEVLIGLNCPEHAVNYIRGKYELVGENFQ